jgi:DNA-binding IclR family transcriptional regulator
MLTPELIRYLRSIRKTAILLILLHILDRPTGETEVARILDISVRSAREMLYSLEQLGLVARTARLNGYHLTPEALQLILLVPPNPSPPTPPGKSL